MSDEVRRPVVRATFRKAVSDDHYGTESAEITLEREDDGMDVNYAEQLLAEARRIVHEELARSPSPAVRRALGKNNGEF
ncbi:MAG TPA: hypothetical protein VGJ60_06985 [Chloroflexota bacterium]|jgi:hypothetical protein